MASESTFLLRNFNPSWNNAYFAPAIDINGNPSGLFYSNEGVVDRDTTRYDYAAKLTFKINNSHTLESTVTAIPSHTNAAPSVR